MVVADTNVIIYLHLFNQQTAIAEALYEQDPDWVAPALWRSEYRNVLALYMRQQLITLAEAHEYQAAAESFLARRDYAISSARVLTLSKQSHCTAYDCEFVALAEELNVPLITADKRLAKAFPEQALLLENAVTSH